MSEDLIRSFNNAIDLLVQHFGEESLGKLKTDIFNIRKLLIQIVPKVLQGFDYYKVRSISSIQAAQIGDPFFDLYNLIHPIIGNIETLIAARFNKTIIDQSLPILIRELQDFATKLQRMETEIIPISVAKSTLDEASIKSLFIQKGPFVGEWFAEIPVGLKRILQHAREVFKEVKEKGEHWTWDQIRNQLLSEAKHVDLVFVESDKPIYHGKVSETIFFDYPIFDNRKVILIEAKTSAEDIISKGIQQILEYRDLFMEDWKNVNVEKLVIISSVWTEEAIKLCEEKQIEGWRVTADSISKVTRTELRKS